MIGQAADYYAGFRNTLAATISHYRRTPGRLPKYLVAHVPPRFPPEVIFMIVDIILSHWLIEMVHMPEQLMQDHGSIKCLREDAARYLRLKPPFIEEDDNIRALHSAHDLFQRRLSPFLQTPLMRLLTRLVQYYTYDMASYEIAAIGDLVNESWRRVNELRMTSHDLTLIGGMGHSLMSGLGSEADLYLVGHPALRIGVYLLLAAQEGNSDFLFSLDSTGGVDAYHRAAVGMRVAIAFLEVYHDALRAGKFSPGFPSFPLTPLIRIVEGHMVHQPSDSDILVYDILTWYFKSGADGTETMCFERWKRALGLLIAEIDKDRLGRSVRHLQLSHLMPVLISYMPTVGPGAARRAIGT
ncbi:hypothetical protein OF83DRAFT_1085128 [Amylostereum chailletii]|nr:hypothetical protein OF83DRAFT_1085128 [Amylostereum chailletii]